MSPFVSQAREQATGELAHMHTGSPTPKTLRAFRESTKTAPSPRSRVRRLSARSGGARATSARFSAVAERGEVHLSLAYEQGGDLLIWATPDESNLPLRAARNPQIVRWYQEDQVMNVVRSDPLGVNRVAEISIEVKGELEDVFNGNERVVAVVIQRPYMRQVYVP
jgi:hypothetical protein